ncbi:MAG TPA: plastocyanin/azurin family copper-binding protein, partial [Baekduia sp.]|nr:plastocyanin/azurin family copper-binding protein [Baekduia sp.]
MSRLLTALAVLAASGAAIAGCGSDDSSSSSGGGGGGGGGGGYGGNTPATTTPSSGTGTDLTIKADESDGLSFDKQSLTAKAGKVTITMDNPSGDAQPHAVSIEGPGNVSKGGRIAQPGGTSTVTVDLKAGTYTFYCPVGSHRQA